MNFDTEEIIVRRLRRELEQVEWVALGAGIPCLVKPRLSEATHSFLIPPNGNSSRSVDVAVVEAAEVSDKGDLVASPPQLSDGLSAARWIVATRHTRDDGQPKLVRACRLPVTLSNCVGLVITELGVIEISTVGLVLREVAPGVGTDEVKLKTAASLHIADDIRLMEL